MSYFKKEKRLIRGVTYARVSTDEQGENGFSLRDQEEKLRRYCTQHGIELVEHFNESYSGKTFIRPEFNRLIELLEKKKGEIDQLLVVRYDRFGRNLIEGMKVMARLTKLKVKFRALDQPLERDEPESKLIEALYLVLPEIENDRRSKSTRDGMRRARIEGWITQRPPKGYIRVPYGERTILAPDENAPLVLESFNEAAKSCLSIDALRRIMNKKGLHISKNQFNIMLKNPIYKGYVYIKVY